MPPESTSDLEDLAFELIAKSSQLTGRINPVVAHNISNLVRSMNCYYSNLIEGHHTHPRDIDRALANDYSNDVEKRNLQKEAVAHITVQRVIAEGRAPDLPPLSASYAQWLRQLFCRELPEDLLSVSHPTTDELIKIEPGQWRTEEVVVGRHEPPLAENLPGFLKRFDEAYNPRFVPRHRRAIAIAAAHHRFLWIHPFLDGNGQVTRLMSHASLLKEGIGSPLWSVSRGLARRIGDYKRLLMAADNRRQGDYDGRGTLSEKALVDFCRFFLETCIDQVDYMAGLIQPEEFLRRLRVFIEDETTIGRLPKGSFNVLKEVFLFGTMERGKAPEITGYKERSARDVISKLTEKGFLESDTPKGSVRLAFPYELVERVFPSLYSY